MANYETKITIYIDNSKLKEFAQDLKLVRERLNKLVAGSPYTFEIIGETQTTKGGRVKLPSSIADKAYRDLITQLLTDANYRTDPKAYSKKIMGGLPLPQRVKAAEPAVNSMREQAIKDYLAASEPIRGGTTRGQAQIAYNVAKAIFGDNILKYRR